MTFNKDRSYKQLDEDLDQVEVHLQDLQEHIDESVDPTQEAVKQTLLVLMGESLAMTFILQELIRILEIDADKLKTDSVNVLEMLDQKVLSSSDEARQKEWESIKKAFSAQIHYTV